MKKISQILLFCLLPLLTFCQKPKVIAFFTPKNDRAHISFVNEANDWFNKISRKQSFTYDTSSNWDNLNTTFLSKYQLVIFLDTRPEVLEQRQAFQKYIEDGGAWVGFHFSAFALNNSKYSQDWDWYHNQFLGSGQYKSNTWRPTSAILKIEDKNHPTSINLPGIFPSSPNEWYRWENDLRQNPDIKVLLSIDAKSFPLGTGPKPHEIWHSGDYPVVWTNTRYRMMYFNMGHNDIDYETGTNRELSHTFKNKTQNQLVINSILWLLRSNR